MGNTHTHTHRIVSNRFYKTRCHLHLISIFAMVLLSLFLLPIFFLTLVPFQKVKCILCSNACDGLLFNASKRIYFHIWVTKTCCKIHKHFKLFLFLLLLLYSFFFHSSSVFFLLSLSLVHFNFASFSFLQLWFIIKFTSSVLFKRQKDVIEREREREIVLLEACWLPLMLMLLGKWM